MKKLITLLLAVLLSVGLSGYEWDNLGPSNVHVNNFSTVFYNVSIEILCTSTGIMINEGNNWVEYSYGDLPAWDVVGLDPNNILVLLGNGSWSDGIYKFNLSNHQFEIVEWMAFPEFLQFCEFDNTYYAGGEYGLWKSTDGLSFEEVDFFNQKKCDAFTAINNHYVVSADSYIYCSDDFGSNWTLVSGGGRYISEMWFNTEETLYGVIPGPSNSSGFHKSDDYGETWGCIHYSLFIKSSTLDSEGNYFLGWESNGVGMLDIETNVVEGCNEGLPNQNINKLTTHKHLDCNNIVACTDSGAYIMTDFTVDISNETIDDDVVELSCFPVPASQSTNIVFKMSKSSFCEISIYDILGNKVKTLFSDNAVASTDYKLQFSCSDIPNGIYYCSLRNKQDVITTKKIIVAK